MELGEPLRDQKLAHEDLVYIIIIFTTRLASKASKPKLVHAIVLYEGHANQTDQFQGLLGKGVLLGSESQHLPCELLRANTISTSMNLESGSVNRFVSLCGSYSLLCCEGTTLMYVINGFLWSGGSHQQWPAMSIKPSSCCTKRIKFF